ncbi:chain length determinant protein tyrosine kinase EpsG [Methylobacillus sp.]|uniref:chain length determinant protein tyrosine kinase EpsG n=1 Tax=Methylobacillus sp. TaxID=56818 RepID=UPI0012CDD8A7|nr:chain length determinant protein tyrosine kinase EpsG [Methylobacillus sp.]MPS48362.1 chain length determinant protein tyrosine kinase EpsG [Methylobacillus sp.]
MSNPGENQKKSDMLQVNALSEFSIGSLLLRMGKITPADAERIMALHKDHGIRFGEAAKNLGLVTDADIQEVLSKQFDYPYLMPEQDTFSPELVMAYQPFSAKAEIYRSIRSQLMIHWFDADKRALALAGINTGDGASVFAANLAVVFSQLGENTLLIDANLRDPKQHEIFGLQERRGLSDILAGRAHKEVITPINSFENLSVLGAGTIPPNPHELVSRSPFRKLIAELTLEYAVILFDAPAFTTGPDVYSIASAIGGAVIVNRKNRTRLADTEAAADQLAANGTRIVGTVLVDF